MCDIKKKSLHQELELDAQTVEDVMSSPVDADMDNTIDDIVDAMDDIDMDETHEDGEDIDTTEGLEEEEIEIHADSEHDAAELELLSDMDNYEEATSVEVKEDRELNEAYNLIDGEIIEAVQEAYYE